MNGHFPGFHAYMYMQSENEIASCSFLQFIYNFTIPCMIGNQLAFPMTERMCA